MRHNRSFRGSKFKGGQRDENRGSGNFRARPSIRFGSRPSRGSRYGTKRIDVARFINKSVVTEEVPNFVPEHSFADFKVAENLKKNILTKGYITPTPIQDRAIPQVLMGRDVVGIANTGTGKTAAFLIPLINKVVLDPKERILIIVPTRELAQQIEQELRDFTPGMGIFSVSCVGGTPIGRQLSQLRYVNHFVIGTPGRLKDLMERKSLDLSRFKTVVLDEADRMLDMGFIGDMKYMMSKMPSPRHTLFFSATLSPEIEVLIKDFLTDPVTISVKTGDVSRNVEQDVVYIKSGQHKIDVLCEMLAKPEFTKVLVFGRTKHGVEKLAKELIARGIKAESIHGNKTQGHRQRSLKTFKDSHAQVLVATDVAARGLDINSVSHVINYDIPATHEDYIHRIGRTGRGDKKGKALTFID